MNIEVEKEIVKDYIDGISLNIIRAKYHIGYGSTLHNILKRNNVQPLYKRSRNTNELPQKKLCSYCKQIKLIVEFRFINRSLNQTQSICKICKSKKEKELYQIPEFRKCTLNRNKNFRSNPINKIKRNKRERQLRQNNPIYRLKINLRNRISEILSNKKRNKSIHLVGCTLKQLAHHLKQLFTIGMSWENYGFGSNKWHVDHIRPCASFDFEDEKQISECFHYTNLQPLWQFDNLSKGSTLTSPHKQKQNDK